MIRWTPQFGITSIPDKVLLSESAKRLRARQPKPPRPKVKRPCEFCQELFGARDMRKHRPQCPRRNDKTPNLRPGWTLKTIIDPKEQERETYRYSASWPVGERLEAVWEATQAAHGRSVSPQRLIQRFQSASFHVSICFRTNAHPGGHAT